MENRYLTIFNLPDDHDEATWGVIRRFWWNPSIVEEPGVAKLYVGDQLAASFETMEELRAFVSGMATVYMAIPAAVVTALEDELGVEADWDDKPDWWSERDLP